MSVLCTVCPLCTGVGMFGEGVGKCRRDASVCDPISALARLCASDADMQGRPQYGTKAVLQTGPRMGQVREMPRLLVPVKRAYGHGQRPLCAAFHPSVLS